MILNFVRNDCGVQRNGVDVPRVSESMWESLKFDEGRGETEFLQGVVAYGFSILILETTGIPD